MRNLLKTCMTISLCSALGACGGGSPDNLAAKLEAALKSGDVDAAMALVDSKDMPSEQKFFYADTVVDCAGGAICTAKAGPLTDSFTQSVEQQKTQGVEVAGKPEGLIEITQKGAGMSGTMSLPYGKVNGEYKILSGRYTADKLAELRAQTAQSKTDAYLKAGVGYPPDPEWKSHATALPADGGDVGAALVSLVKARVDAVKSGDVDKRIAAGDERDAIIYAAKGFDGKERALKTRQLSMRTQSLREWAEVKVLGGYQNGNTAVLIVEGHDGNGWVVRGAQVMTQKDGKWNTGTADLVATPAA